MFRTVPFRPSTFALALAAVAATALTLSSAAYATQTYNSSKSKHRQPDRRAQALQLAKQHACHALVLAFLLPAPGKL